MSEQTLQIAEKRRETKVDGERGRFTQRNVEFQRLARRDKKDFLNEQCKEIEENNRMGKTRDLFKKTADIKGTFHARMGTIKDRNSKDLAEVDAFLESPSFSHGPLDVGNLISGSFAFSKSSLYTWKLSFTYC